MDTTDTGDENTTTTGRRLRARPTKVESTNEDSGSGRGRSRQKKRKAEVNIESLYLQETNREVCPTPLETIFEAPQHARKNRNRKGSAGESIIHEDDETRQTGAKNGDELGLSTVMGGKKIKRLCLFTSHYYPSKQKERMRKDRARKMKQLRGVKIPKGVAISVQDVKEVLAKLSDDESEQNENNQNRNNCGSVSLNTSVGFYVGNVIRPDTGDESFLGMIEDMQALQVDLSKESIDEETPTIKDDALPLPAFLELDEPLPFTDPLPESRPNSKSRDNRSRRRSGRVSGCLLSSASRPAGEDSISPQKSELLPDLNVSKPIDANILSDSISEAASCQMTEISGPGRQIVAVAEEEVKEEVTTIRDGTKRRKTVKTHNLKSTKKAELFKRSSELQDPELVKKMKGPKNSNSLDTESDTKFTFKMSTSDTSSSLTSSAYNSSDYSLPSPSDLRAKTAPSRRGVRRQRGRRRVSGIQRSLYHNQLVLSSSENSSPESFLKSSFTEVEEPSTKPDNSEQVKISPTSPSSQMAALSLHSDLPFTSSGQDVEPEPDKQDRKTMRKARRRSSRLVIGTSPSRASPKATSSLGSYWSSSSPSPLQPSVLALSAVPENLQESVNSITSAVTSHLIDTCESKFTLQKEDDSIGLPIESLPIPEVNLSDHKTEDSKVTEMDTFNNGICIPTHSFSDDKPLVTDENTVNNTDHRHPLETDEKVTIEDEPGNSNSQDCRTPRKNEKCIWDTFRQNPKLKSKQKSKKSSVRADTNNKPSTSTGNTDNHSKVTGGNESTEKKSKSAPKGSKKECILQKNYSTDSDHHSPNYAKIASPATFSSMKKEDTIADWGSPVISGMFEGKASIRLGKVFCNKESFLASPITVSQLCQTSGTELSTAPEMQQDNSSSQKSHHSQEAQSTNSHPLNSSAGLS